MELKLKKIFLLSFAAAVFFPGAVFCDDFVDDSIDSAIRAKYNTKKIESDLLPALPSEVDPFDTTIDAFSPSPAESPAALPAKPENPSPVTVPAKVTTTNTPAQNSVKSTAVLKKGKKFRVKLQNAVSDKTKPGSRVSFVSTAPETFTYITIPAGTVFKGRIVDSHQPYISGNGGLIVIKVDEMVYKGAIYEIDAKISVANDKKIFLNNIKGKRKYLQNMWNSTTFGSKYLKKMWKSSCKFAKKGGINLVIAPFPTAAGLVVYGANVVSSPVIALFTKGGSISIPAGAKFVIQLREDAVIIK